jgi:DNA gyrase/topoisomerase IV subunit B
MTKTIEQQFKILTELERVRARPGIYVRKH